MDSETPRDERILRATRWTLWVVAPILVAAGIILFGFPARTPQLWAWTIGSEMTAMAIGAGYLAGAFWFVAAGLGARRFSQLAVGLSAAAVLTVLLLIVTVLHWSAFNHDHVSFVAWLVIYVATPLWLPALVVVNGRHAAREPAPGEQVVPQPLRGAVAAAGVVLASVAAVMFVRPSALLSAWPWPLTPLTARTVAAFLSFIAVLWLAFAFERRWSALELPVIGAIVGLTLVGVAALRARHEFDGLDDPATFAFVIALVGAVVGLSVLTVAMRTAAERTPGGSGGRYQPTPDRHRVTEH